MYYLCLIKIKADNTLGILLIWNLQMATLPLTNLEKISVVWKFLESVFETGSSDNFCEK